MRECICTFSQKMVGDGCEACNPELAIELLEEATRDLEIQLKDLQFLLDECRPWMRSEETPAQCIDRLNGEAIKALQREVAALDKFLALRKGLRNLLGSVE